MIVGTLPVQPGYLEEPFTDMVFESFPGPVPEFVGGIPDVIRFVCTPEILAESPDLVAAERAYNEAAAAYLPCISYRYDPTIPVVLGSNGAYAPVNTADKWVAIVSKTVCIAGSCMNGAMMPTYIMAAGFSTRTMIHETMHMLTFACNKPQYAQIDKPYGTTETDAGRFHAFCPGACQYHDTLTHLVVTPPTSNGQSFCKVKRSGVCDYPVQLYAGMSLPLEATVTNAGRVAVSTYIVRFLLRPTTSGVAPVLSQEVRVTSPLAPGQSRTVTTTIQLPANPTNYYWQSGSINHSLLDQVGSTNFCAEVVPG